MQLAPGFQDCGRIRAHLNDHQQSRINEIVQNMTIRQGVEKRIEENTRAITMPRKEYIYRISITHLAYQIAQIMMNALHLSASDKYDAQDLELRIAYAKHVVTFRVSFPPEAGSYWCAIEDKHDFEESSKTHYDGNLFLNGAGKAVYYLTVLNSHPTHVERFVFVKPIPGGVETILRPRPLEPIKLGDIIMPQIVRHGMPTEAMNLDSTGRIMIRLAVSGPRQIVLTDGVSTYSNLRV